MVRTTLVLIDFSLRSYCAGRRSLAAIGASHRCAFVMADAARVLSAAALDQMSPDDRARVVGESIVTDLDELPPGFRGRVEATAARLAIGEDEG